MSFVLVFLYLVILIHEPFILLFTMIVKKTIKMLFIHIFIKNVYRPLWSTVLRLSICIICTFSILCNKIFNFPRKCFWRKQDKDSCCLREKKKKYKETLNNKLLLKFFCLVCHTKNVLNSN